MPQIRVVPDTNDYIVTGDPDLTDMKEFQGIKILTPNKFLRLVF